MNGFRIMCSRDSWPWSSRSDSPVAWLVKKRTANRLAARQSMYAKVHSPRTVVRYLSMSLENHSANSACESNSVGMMKWRSAQSSCMVF